jgi:dihydrodipicolinate synthase/N-acetylneuraminate lyase
MKILLTGIVPPVVTPLDDRDQLDVDGFERLLERIIAGGVSGVFILGTTGEGPSLSYRLRREVIDQACRIVNRRVPVLVGITDTAFVESVQLARHAATAGVDAVVLAPPYYLPEAQPELREYLTHLLPELPLPLFLYNMPGLTKVSIEKETTLWALEQPGIVGLKDSSGDLNYFSEAAGLLKRRPDWPLLIGPEEKLLAALQAGGHGGVNGGANVFPRLYVELHTAFRSGDLARAQILQTQIQQVSSALYHVGRHPSAIIKGIKCALACLGVCNDFMAEPFHRFRAPERQQVEQKLAQLKTDLDRLGIAY